MDPNEIKRLKEAFVSDLEGTTKLEIWQAISCLPVSILLGTFLQATLLQRVHNLSELAKQVLSFTIQAAAAILPQLVVTMSSVSPVYCSVPLLAITCAWAWYCLGQRYSRHQNLPWTEVFQSLEAKKLLFLSIFRGGIMLYTCLCILAVDFKAYPRRYAKAETYGTGLMDLGVGATLFAGGLVSKAVDQDAWQNKKLAHRLESALKSTLPVLAIGFGRLVATTAVGYQHHVGEYGTHWNFFFAIAAVGLLTTLAQVPAAALLPSGIATICAYQAFLSFLGFSDWVHSPEREPNIISMNKEGLCSLWGFWALYLLGAATGYQLQLRCKAAVSHFKLLQPIATTDLASPATTPVAVGPAAGDKATAGSPEGDLQGVQLSKEQQQQVTPRTTPYNLRPRRPQQLGQPEQSRPSLRRRSSVAASAVAVAGEVRGCLSHDPATPLRLAYGPPPSPAAAATAAAGTSAAVAASGPPAAAVSGNGILGVQSCSLAGTSTTGIAAGRLLGSWVVAWLLFDLGTWGLLHMVEELIEPVSRRSCNMAYVLWVCVQSLDLLLLCFLVQVLISLCIQGFSTQANTINPSPSRGHAAGTSNDRSRRRISGGQPQQVWQQQGDGWGEQGSGHGWLLPVSFNRNLLVVFLLANVLTGLVNLSINTLEMGHWQARSTVGVYMLVVSSIATVLDLQDINVKL